MRAKLLLRARPGSLYGPAYAVAGALTVPVRGVSNGPEAESSPELLRTADQSLQPSVQQAGHGIQPDTSCCNTAPGCRAHRATAAGQLGSTHAYAQTRAIASAVDTGAHFAHDQASITDTLVCHTDKGPGVASAAGHHRSSSLLARRECPLQRGSGSDGPPQPLPGSRAPMASAAAPEARRTTEESLPQHQSLVYVRAASSGASAPTSTSRSSADAWQAEQADEADRLAALFGTDPLPTPAPARPLAPHPTTPESTRPSHNNLNHDDPPLPGLTSSFHARSQTPGSYAQAASSADPDDVLSGAGARPHLHHQHHQHHSSQHGQSQSQPQPQEASLEHVSATLTPIHPGWNLDASRAHSLSLAAQQALAAQTSARLRVSVAAPHHPRSAASSLSLQSHRLTATPERQGHPHGAVGTSATTTATMDVLSQRPLSAFTLRRPLKAHVHEGVGPGAAAPVGVGVSAGEAAVAVREAGGLSGKETAGWRGAGADALGWPSGDEAARTAAELEALVTAVTPRGPHVVRAAPAVTAGGGSETLRGLAMQRLMRPHSPAPPAVAPDGQGVGAAAAATEQQQTQQGLGIGVGLTATTYRPSAAELRQRLLRVKSAQQQEQQVGAADVGKEAALVTRELPAAAAAVAGLEAVRAARDERGVDLKTAAVEVDAAAAGVSAADAAAAAKAATEPHYCDEALTHAPPDEELYLGDRDAALQAATDRKRRFLGIAAFESLYRLLGWQPWGTQSAELQTQGAFLSQPGHRWEAPTAGLATRPAAGQTEEAAAAAALERLGEASQAPVSESASAAAASLTDVAAGSPQQHLAAVAAGVTSPQTADATIRPDGAAGVSAAKVAAAGKAATEPHYCDEALTHAPPDEELYLGDRDAALQAAADRARSEAILGGPVALSSPTAPSLRQQLQDRIWGSWRIWGGQPDTATTSRPAGNQGQPQAVEADAVYDDILESLRSNKDAAAAATTVRVGKEAAATATPTATDAMRAEQPGPGVGVEVERGSRGGAGEEVFISGIVLESQQQQPQQQLGAQVGRDAEWSELEGTSGRGSSTVTAQAISDAAALQVPVSATAPVRGKTESEGEQGVLAAGQRAMQEGAVAAAAAAARGGPLTLLDLIRSPQATQVVITFSELRAAHEARMEVLRRQAAAAAVAAAEAEAAAETVAEAQPANGGAVVFAEADVEEGLSLLLSQAAGESSASAGGGGKGGAATASAVGSSGQRQPQKQQSGAAQRGKRQGAAATASAAANDDWAAEMAALFASPSSTSTSSTGLTATTAASTRSTTEPYTDESAGDALEAAGSSEGAAAPSTSGRRSLFGEPQQIIIPDGITVRGLAALLGVSAPRLEAFLREQLGEKVASELEEVAAESAELAALEFGRIGIVRPAEGGGSSAVSLPRQPVVAILGHVDHGKTSLLDALRSSNVAAQEAGGITQHIGAFEVTLASGGSGSGQSASAPGSLPSAITFVDTPGHEAFSAMRARGAAVTDVAVLVVAADEGVKPQTREALAHARSAGCPVVVALTKCDKPAARPDFVKAQLAAEGLDLEDFGGGVQVVHTSATTGVGLRELEEALLLQAELMELRAPVEGPASGYVIEARVERGLGPVATAIVKRGSLKVGDPVVVGTEYGRVRMLRKEAGTGGGGGSGATGQLPAVMPGQYALVSGLEGLPQAGDQLLVVPDETRARNLAAARRLRASEFRRLQLAAALHLQRQREVAQLADEYNRRRTAKAEAMLSLRERKRRTADKLRQQSEQHRGATAEEGAVAGAEETDEPPARMQQAAGGEAAALTSAAAPAVTRQVAQLNLVVKADVQGAVEAVLAMVESLATEQQQTAAEAAAAAATAAGAAAAEGGDAATSESSLTAAASAAAAAASAGGYVGIRVVHAGVGALTPSDVNLAVAAGAHIVLFNTSLGSKIDLNPAQQAGVRLLSHNVVYHLMDAIRAEVGRLAAGAAAEEAAAVLSEVGSAEVLATFPLTSSKKVKEGCIAGVRVVSGEVSVGQEEVWRVVRGGAVVWEGPCTSLRKHKDRVRSVVAGVECGVVLADGQFSAFQPGDRLVCLRAEKDAGRGAGAAGGKVGTAAGLGTGA